jgi:hypothetical protein
LFYLHVPLDFHFGLVLFCRLTIVFSLSDSSISLSSALEGSNVASGIVRALFCLISSGVTASALNRSLKGDRFIVVDTAVLWLHTAFGITSADLPFFLPLRDFLIASKIRVFAHSIVSLVCR